MARRLIMSPERVQRMLVRLSCEIVERNRGASDVELVGIRRRGSAVAEAIAREMEVLEGRTFEVSNLDVSAYRDDRDPDEEIADTSHMAREIADRDVVLVDDVLFTGRTARAALDALVHYGRPRSIQMVVLVDRGHREYPIQPDYIGLFLQTKHRERVDVDVNDGFTIHVVE
ncbi:MAG: bifunctional pyr operon transcriptional regulator/uracil phosphoribosyltransferase PyrR [Bacteroidetes bacterium SB0662_bin_6]|nr:bifunctional pyr operon transcriptional regulator/uracil phosphoribosyltransferase PyrR [Bacteroidetes bacterium SB0668_bin_1]MYE03962.1 bifunctional pyr operon transcriptional regulator/uracil phosphoribosyltransferase PyrR [Bacteroidetes bacterium SB0662_bin_6]